MLLKMMRDVCSEELNSLVSAGLGRVMGKSRATKPVQGGRTGRGQGHGHEPMCLQREARLT